MANNIENKARNKVIHKFFMYLIFTVAMSWSPIIVNFFISFFFTAPYKTFFDYRLEICFMCIVLEANNIKDLYECHFFKKKKLFFDFLASFNILNFAISLLYFSVSSFLELSEKDYIQPESKQFFLVMITYFMAFLMGIIVRYADGIDEIKRAERR